MQEHTKKDKGKKIQTKVNKDKRHTTKGVSTKISLSQLLEETLKVKMPQPLISFSECCYNNTSGQIKRERACIE